MYYKIAILLLSATLIFGCKDPEVIDPDPNPVDSIGDVNVWLTSGNEVFMMKKQAPVDF